MTTNRLARPLALVAAAAFAVTACGSSTPTTPPATATSAPVTDAPTVTAPPASGLPGFSFDLPSADKELEAILPSELGGVALQKVSMTGDAFVGMGEGTEEMEATLQALGKAPSDLSVAFAGGSASVVLIAFRIKGVDANAIYQAVVAAQGSGATANIADVTVGGKAAKKIVDAAGATTYLYLTGDAVVTVTGVGTGLTDALLTEIFTKLP